MIDDQVQFCNVITDKNSTNIVHSDMSVFYVRKNWYAHEKVTFAKDFQSYTPNLGELLINVLSRVSGRFSPSEIEYITRETGKNPVYDINEGKNNVYSSSSKIRSMLKVWKAARKSAVLPLSDEQIRQVDNYCDTVEQSVSCHSEPAKNIKQQNVFLTINTNLPMLVGCVVSASDRQLIELLADSGASISLLRKDVYLSLNLSLSSLSEQNCYSISTATTQSSSALGSVQLAVYLLSKNKQFYKIMIKFIVVDAFIPAAVIGMPDLRRLRFAWSSNGKNEELLLDCMSSFGKTVRRAFLTNNEISCETLPDTDQLFSIQCDQPYLIFDECNYKITNLSSNRSVVVDGKNISCTHELNYDQNWPINIVTTCQISCTDLAGLSTKGQIFSIQQTSSDCSKSMISNQMFLSDPYQRIQTQSVYSTAQTHCTDTEPVPDYIDISETDLADLEVKSADYCKSFDETDAMIVGRISTAPEPIESCDKLQMPELSHLSPEWQEKYKELFTEYKDAVSQNSKHLGRCTLPPVHINTTPGVTHYQTPKRYSKEEELLLREHVRELEELGIVEPITHYTSWSHDILLVPKSDKVKLDRTAVGKSRLEQLKEGIRFCSNLKHINKVLPPVNSTVLSNFNEILPLLGGRKVAAFDARSGYFQIGLDSESRDIFSFHVGSKKWRYCVLPQGLVSACAIFQSIMELIISEEEWEAFKKEVNQDCLRDCLHKLCFVVYLDDTLVIMRTSQQLYWGCTFILRQYKKYNMTVSAKKICIDHPETTVLGFCVSSKTNTYKLSAKRADAILAWPMPINRPQVQSRIAALQYFGQVIPGLKHLAFCLGLLAKSKNKTFHLEQVHFVEFLMLRLIVAINIELSVPRLSEGQVLFCSSDASFGIMSSIMFQNEPDLDSEGIPHGERKFRVCGVTSRNFQSADLQRHVVWKEAISMLNCLETYKFWIQSSAKTIFFVDCISLAFISRLKVQSSKLYTYSMYLSSLRNVYFIHSRGSRFMVSLADLLSRGLGEAPVKAPVSIPADILENVSGVKFKENFVVTPEVLYRLMTGDLPGYFSDLPFRKRQRAPPDMEYRDLDKILSMPPPEKEVLDVVYGGYEAIRPDTVAFIDPESNKKISRSQFEVLRRKYSLDTIKELCNMVICHSYHVTDISEISGIIDKLMSELNCYFVGRKLTEYQAEVHSNIIHFINSQDKCVSLLKLIISQILLIPELSYSSVSSGLVPVQAMLCKQSSNSDVRLDVIDNRLCLLMTRDFTLQPNQVRKVNLSLLFNTSFCLEFVSLWEEVTVTAQVGEVRTESLMTVAVVFNHTSEVSTLSSGGALGYLEYHGGDQECVCQLNFKKLLILDRVFGEIDMMIESQQVENQTRFLLFNITSQVTSELMDQIKKQAVLCDGIGAALYPCYNTVVKEGLSLTKADYNKIILLSSLIQENKLLSNKIIREFQRSCSHLAGIIEQVESGRTTQFILKGGILFKIDIVLGVKVHKLALDRVTCLFICENLHSSSNMHYSSKVMMSYLNSMFYCLKMFEIIEQAAERCSICYFSMPCYRNKLIVKHVEEPPPVGFYWFCDLVENLNRDKLGYKFVCLLCEYRTTFTIVVALKTTKSSELAQKLDPLMTVFGMSELKSDYGPTFRGDFQKLLKRYHVVHSKSAPSSPAENYSELILKLWRRSFKAFLLGLPSDQKPYWSRHLYYFNTIWNSSILHPEKQPLTRFNLFMNPRRSLNARFLSVLEGTSDSMIMQNTAQQILDDLRLERKRTYKSGNIPKFVKGMLVCLLSTKSELQVTHPSAGLLSNNQKIFRILSLTRSAARCVNIVNGDCQTIGLGKLKPVNSEILYGHFGFDPVARGSFEKNMFSTGPQRSLLQVLSNPDTDVPEMMDENEPSLEEISQQYDRSYQDDDDLGEDSGDHGDSDHVHDQGQGGGDQEDPSPDSHLVEESRKPYNLRPRTKVRVNVITTKRVYFAKNYKVRYYSAKQLCHENLAEKYFPLIKEKYYNVENYFVWNCNPDYSKAEWRMLSGK